MSQRYEITAPDGRRFEVTAPAGATEDQVLAYAERMIRARPATFGQSVAQGLGDVPQGGAQLLTRALPRGVVDAVNSATETVNNLPVIGPVTRALGMTPATPEQVQAQTVEREQTYQASRAAGGANPDDFDWGRMVGQAIPATAAALATRSPTTIRGAVAQGAGQGALFGAVQPVTNEEEPFSDQKARQIAGGAAFGAVGGGAGAVVGRTIAPNADPQARALYNEGVRLTPGQAAGGAVRRVEDALTSVPLVGDAVREGQRGAIESFNRVVGNRVLRPLGTTVPDEVPAGRELVEFVGQRISQAYDDAISRAQPFGPDAKFAQDLAALGQQFLTPARRADFNAIVRDRVMSRFQSGQIAPEDYQTVRSLLGTLGREYRSAGDVTQREMAEAFFGLQRAFDDLLARANPQIARELRAANTANAAFVRMSDAAGRQGATDGVFSPAQLSAAVRAGDSSVRRNAYARGDALLQDMSDAGRAVLPSTVPDSGTAGRLATMGVLGSLASGQFGVPMPAALGGAAAAGIYTPLGMRLLSSLALAERPMPVQAAGALVARSGAPVSVPLAGMVLSPPEQRP